MWVCVCVWVCVRVCCGGGITLVRHAPQYAAGCHVGTKGRVANRDDAKDSPELPDQPVGGGLLICCVTPRPNSPKSAGVAYFRDIIIERISNPCRTNNKILEYPNCSEFLVYMYYKLGHFSIYYCLW